jgi:carboxyl-terminal processing protease
MNKSFFSAIALFAFLAPNILFAQVNKEIRHDMRPAEVLQYIDGYYVDAPDMDALATEAIIAILEKLDPHSTYISREDVAEANQQIQGSFVGVGIRFQIVKDTLLVINTIEGGPSEKVGILAGDQILAVEAENIAGVGIKNSDIRSRLLGEKGTRVQLTIKRKNSEELLTFTVVRDKIIENSVVSYYMVDKKIGYIKLIRFSRNSLDEIKEAITKLKEQGMEDLIVDLQDNGGGLLDICAYIADEFLDDKKLIVYSEGRKRPRKEYKAEKKGSFEKGRLVILINENSASASEILSGAVQDWDRGLIVGRRSFGKGLVQQPISLSDGSEMRLTIARYYTPSGRFIQKPYEEGNGDAYRQEKLNRYLSGEVYAKDSIDFPDSLKYQTLVKKRTVYGGGGIMPDVFVPIDTTGINELFRSLVRNGYFNNFSVDMVNNNRNYYKSIFTNFVVYNQSFYQHFTDKMEQEFLEYLKSENPDLEYTAEDYAYCRDLIAYRLKAAFASNLFGLSESYQVSNEFNGTLKRAVEILQSKEYNKFNLAKP